MYADKKMLQSLALSFVPAGVVALVVGSLAADREKSKGSAFLWAGFVAVAWMIIVPQERGFGTFIPAWQAQIVMGTCLGAGLLSLALGSVFRHTPDNRTLDQFYLLLRTPVGREDDLKNAGVDVIYAGHSEGHPWELNHPRLVNIGGFLVAALFSLAILGLLYALSRIGA
jgi:hypothetical protein